MKTLFTKLAVFALLFVGAFAANAHTQAMYIVNESDGSITFYAETYYDTRMHPNWDGNTPTGDLILAGGGSYAFTSVVRRLPRNARLLRRCASRLTSTRFQVVNIKRCGGRYAVRTSSNSTLVPNPRCSFYGYAYFTPNRLTATASTDASTVYYGYSPMACANLSATASGGVGPYTYIWSNGSTGPSITVCPTTTTTYYVTVTDKCRRRVRSFVTVNVVDVRCGKNLDKVAMCKRPGKSGRTVNICVEPGSVPDQLGNGSTLGPCPQGKIAFETDEEAGIKAFPNPFTDKLSFQFVPKVNDHVKVEAFDITGKSLGVLFDKDVEAGIHYNGIQSTVNFPKGIIMLRYTSATEVRVLKVHHQ